MKLKDHQKNRHALIIQAVVALFIIFCSITTASAFAVPIDNEAGDIRESDPGVTPTDLSFQGADSFEPDDTSATARVIRIDSAPEDRTLYSRQDKDWLHIMCKDGPGYLRIGATGPIGIDYYGEEGESFKEVECSGPVSRAVLTEDVDVLPYDLVKGWGQAGYYFRIRNLSDKPVIYRLSAISELPDRDVGMESAQLAAEHYIFSIAEGDLRHYFEATRSHVTAVQITSLRKDLFKKTEPFRFDLGCRYPGWDDPESFENRPVQRMIWASTEDYKGYALEVICQKKDNLWLAVSARLDPNIGPDELATIIKESKEEFQRPIGGGSRDSIVKKDASRSEKTEIANSSGRNTSLNWNKELFGQNSRIYFLIAVILIGLAFLLFRVFRNKADK